MAGVDQQTTDVTLTPDQINWVIRRIAKWVQVLEDHETLPNSADVTHSSLLYRLLSGKEPLPVAPPRSFSRPNYALGEGMKVRVGTRFVPYDNSYIVLDQSQYEYADETKTTVRYPETGETFRLWQEQGEWYLQKTTATEGDFAGVADQAEGKKVDPQNAAVGD